MRADRLLAIVLVLQKRGRIKSRELASELGVSLRTIYRDVDALASAGVPVWSETGPHGGIGLVDDYRLKLDALSSDEAEALTITSATMVAGELGIAGAVRTALTKLVSSMPALQQAAAEEAKQRILIDTSSWFRKREDVPHLSALREAAWQNRRVRIHYRRGESAIAYTVDAYALVVKIDTWYFVGETKKGMTTFRVSRIESVEPLDETFTRRAEFDLATHWEEFGRDFVQSFPRYEVTLRNKAERLTWPMIATIGEDVFTYDMQREDFAISTILPLGDRVEVLAPDELREKVKRIAAEINRLYN